MKTKNGRDRFVLLEGELWRFTERQYVRWLQANAAWTGEGDLYRPSPDSVGARSLTTNCPEVLDWARKDYAAEIERLREAERRERSR